MVKEKFDVGALLRKTQEELQGYAPLGALEVTACANRGDAGEFKVNLSNLYYETEGENYTKYVEYKEPEIKEFGTVTLAKEDGSEGKFSLGTTDIYNGNWVFTTTVRIDTLDTTGNMRPIAFAFNSSDNSWYNIELSPEEVVNSLEECGFAFIFAPKLMASNA